MNILIKVLVTAVALWASTIVDGIGLGGDSIWVNAGTLLVVAVMFGILNAILKPIIKTVGCRFYVLTLGLIGLVVNALLFLLVGWLSEQFKLPFEVDGFWAGFWGAIIVTVVSFVLHLVIPEKSDKD